MTRDDAIEMDDQTLVMGIDIAVGSDYTAFASLESVDQSESWNAQRSDRVKS